MIDRFRIVFSAKVLGAVLIASSAVAQAGDKHWWKLSSTVKLISVLVPIGVGLLGAISSATAQMLTRKNVRLKGKINRILTSTAFDIQDMSDIDMRDIGMAVFVRKRWGWWKWPWQEHLYLLERVRPRLAVVSGVSWRVGVGVIGRCVEQGKDICLDIVDFETQLSAVTSDDWRDLPTEVTLGLTHEEFQKLLGKFYVVLASPILDGSKAVGCVAVDGPRDTFDVLFSNPVRGQTSAAARKIVTDVLH